MSVKFKKMMAKMKQKLGFTLIEMLIVIAIIAIIVSIGMPMIQTSIIKSAAATNAANLRAVEGQISTMRIFNPRAFENLDFKELEDDKVGDKDDFWGSVGNMVAILGSSMATYTASDDGVITLSSELVVNNVPSAAKMTFTDSSGRTREITEDTPMSVYISEHGAVATYMGIPKEAFAEVAETGKFTGEFGKTDEEKWEEGMGDLKEEIDQVVDRYTCAVCGVLCAGNSRCSGHTNFQKCSTCNNWYDATGDCMTCNPPEIPNCKSCTTCTGWKDVQNNTLTFINYPDGKCDTCSHSESVHNKK